MATSDPTIENHADTSSQEGVDIWNDEMGGGQNLERPKCRTADISDFRNLEY